MSNNFLGKTIRNGCIGCVIVDDNSFIPGGVIFENESFMLHQDPEYPIATFFIITAKRHFKYFNDMTDEEYKDYFDILKIARKILFRLGVAKEYSIINEERSSHFHTWFFPRLDWMDMFDYSLSETRNIMKYIKNKGDSNNIDYVMECVERAKDIIKNKDW